MKIFRAYQKTKFFLAVNILGLATGLAAAIMLILFVINEYSYDKHFANAERIVSLNTYEEDADVFDRMPINLRAAYTQLPARVPGIEAATQIYDGSWTEVRHGDERTNGSLFYADPGFFDVFQMKFVEGTPQGALADASSLVVTRPQAEAMFGGTAEAMGQTVEIDDAEYTVTAVVEPLPLNTHFSFEIMARISSREWLEEAGGLEFHTFYLIEANQSLPGVRAAIEKEYTALLQPWAAWFSGKAYAATEKLTDIYLHGAADWTLGKRNTMGFIRMLTALAFFILLFAITNFVNLFTAQGETRMREIGVRKTYGAQPADIVRQLFSETGVLVAVAFAIGIVLAVLLTPYFSNLIGKEIDTRQFFNPLFIACTAGLLAVTVVLSASYTSFYLSRRNPLDILGKRLSFSKGRLTTSIVAFQSMVTIVLMAMIMIVNGQARYLKDIPVGYDSQDVMMLRANSLLAQNYDAVKQELSSLPFVEAAAGSDHAFGLGYSGQSIKRTGSDEGAKGINENRIHPGFGELMRFELVEGEFWGDDTPDTPIVLNEAAVRMLGLETPVAGRQVEYKGGPVTVTGVVRDFIYGDPAGEIQPLAFARPYGVGVVSVRLHRGTDRLEARTAVQAALRKFDPDFVLSPMWSEDIYESRFSNINDQGRIIFVGSLLSVFLAMMGLLAIHLYSAVRRTKEIGIRRISGATRGEIFLLLSKSMLRWILISGVVAVPITWWLATEWLASSANHVALNWAMFVVPIVIQMAVALAVTSGVSVRVSSRNPVESLKSE